MTDRNVNATITVTLPTDVVAKIAEVSHNKGCTESSVLQDALTIYLNNWEWYDTLLRNEEYAKELGIGPDDVDRLIQEYREEVRAENRPQA